MIPTLQQIWADLKSGLITIDQAAHWVDEHMKLASNLASGDLRDSFAMTAMQGALASSAWNNHDAIEDVLATKSYLMADAMMKART